MKFKKSFLLFFIIPLLSFSVHKYYLSLTQVEFNTEGESVQIITNVFLDDIELAINKNYNVDAQLTTKAEIKNIDSLFTDYLVKNLSFKIDNSKKKYHYIGKEYEGDIVYFYLEIEDINKISSIEIKNTILTKHFPEQQNLVKVKVNGKHASKMLTKDTDKGLLKF